MPCSGSGSLERALELGVDDRVDVARFAAAGVADGLLAFGVGPAGAVGDHVTVVGARGAGRRSRRAPCSWSVVGSVRPARMSWPSADVAACRFGVAGAVGGAPLAVVGGGVA